MMAELVCTLATELTAVCFFKQRLNVLGRFGLTKQFAKLVISELSRDVFEGSEVVTGTIWRRD
jgi:hypothetical protein